MGGQVFLVPQNGHCQFLQFDHCLHLLRKWQTRQIVKAFFLCRKYPEVPPHLLSPELPFLFKLVPLEDIGKASHRPADCVARESAFLLQFI